MAEKNINKKKIFCPCCDTRRNTRLSQWKNRVTGRSIPKKAEIYELIPKRSNKFGEDDIPLLCNVCYSIIKGQTDLIGEEPIARFEKIEQKTEDGRIFYRYERKIEPETIYMNGMQRLSYIPSNIESVSIENFMMNYNCFKELLKMVHCSDCHSNLQEVKHTQIGLQTKFYFVCENQSCKNSFLFESIKEEKIKFPKENFEIRKAEAVDFTLSWNTGTSTTQYFNSKETSLAEENCYKFASILSDITYNLGKQSSREKFHALKKLCEETGTLVDFISDGQWITKRNSFGFWYSVKNSKTNEEIWWIFISKEFFDGSSQSMELAAVIEACRFFQYMGFLKFVGTWTTDGSDSVKSQLSRYPEASHIVTKNDPAHINKNINKKIIEKLGINTFSERVINFYSLSIHQTRSLPVPMEEKNNILEFKLDSMFGHFNKFIEVLNEETKEKEMVETICTPFHCPCMSLSPQTIAICQSYVLSCDWTKFFFIDKKNKLSFVIIKKILGYLDPKTFKRLISNSPVLI